MVSLGFRRTAPIELSRRNVWARTLNPPTLPAGEQFRQERLPSMMHCLQLMAPDLQRGLRLLGQVHGHDHLAPGSHRSDHGQRRLTFADIGTQVCVADLGNYRTANELARVDTSRRPWLAWAGYVLGTVAAGLDRLEAPPGPRGRGRSANLVLFDALAGAGEDLSGLPPCERRAQLEQLAGVRPIRRLSLVRGGGTAFVPVAVRVTSGSSGNRQSSGMNRNMPRVTTVRALVLLAPVLAFAAVAIGHAGVGWAGTPAGGEVAAPPAVIAAPVAGCLTDDLAGTVFGLPGTGRPGVRDAVLRLTNSGRTCQVTGRPKVAMVTPPGELVVVPTAGIGEGAGVVVLKPGASAWARIQWDTCEAGRKGCRVGVALQYIVDPASTGAVADSSSVPEADRDGITMTALRVGPLRPDRAAALTDR